MNMEKPEVSLFRAYVQDNKILRERLEACERLVKLLTEPEERRAEQVARYIEFERELFWSSR